MNIWKSLAGMAAVELTSAEPAQTLQVINQTGIGAFHVQERSLLTVSFTVYRNDIPVLKELCQKRGEDLKILRKMGFYWTAIKLIHRPVLLSGALLFLWLLFFIPSRVLFVQVEGNDLISDQQILAAAEDSGIRFGASRRKVRSETVKNALLSAVPELQWAGVNTRGCVAVISVRERAKSQDTEEAEYQVSSIVASRDGQILSGTVTRGNGLFQVGQVVQEGQVLISGYTDCGICIQATQAEGEVFAQTRHNLEAITPVSWTWREKEKRSSRKISLLLGKKRINLWKGSGIWDPSCGRMYQEYYVNLPGGFRLPVALCIETDITWEITCRDLSQGEAEADLKEFAGDYLLQQMIAGSLQSRTETITRRDSCFRLEGVYVCREMIGRVRQEQIGETNGETG